MLTPPRVAVYCINFVAEGVNLLVIWLCAARRTTAHTAHTAHFT
jgi:hypothetical protein